MTSMKRDSKLVAVAVVVLAAASSIGWRRLPGSPGWTPDRNGDHYVVSINFNDTIRVVESLDALSDLAKCSGFRFRRSPYVFPASNHVDGNNAWGMATNLGPNVLGLTTYRVRGGRFLEADVEYDANRNWGTLFDPCANHGTRISFRGVARHEALHVAGLDHEDGVLACTNSVYSHGSSVPHARGHGMLPHPDDQAGLRAIYGLNPNETPWVNLLATCWSTVPGARFRVSGTYVAGSQLSVRCTLGSQSSVPVSGIKLRLLLSKNRTFSKLDASLREFLTGSWSPQHLVEARLKAPIPLGTPVGTYHVGVLFDTDNKYPEQFESDNACHLGTITVRAPITVNSVSPSRGTLIGGDRVTIRGSGFDRGTVVYFDGVRATSINFISGSAITCNTPTRLQRGFVDVRVENVFTGRTLFSGYEYVGGHVAATGHPTRGVRFPFGLSAGVDANRDYMCAASLTAQNGFGLGVRRFPLDVDGLFVLSVSGAAPGVFENFRGRLDAAGRATVAMTVPNGPLVGVRFHVAFLTLDPMKPLGIRTVSAPQAFAVQ